MGIRTYNYDEDWAGAKKDVIAFARTGDYAILDGQLLSIEVQGRIVFLLDEDRDEVTSYIREEA